MRLKQFAVATRQLPRTRPLLPRKPPLLRNNIRTRPRPTPKSEGVSGYTVVMSFLCLTAYVIKQHLIDYGEHIVALEEWRDFFRNIPTIRDVEIKEREQELANALKEGKPTKGILELLAELEAKREKEKEKES